MIYVGFITLTIFVVAILGLLLKKIPLPVQTVMVLVTLINVVIGFIARLVLPEGGGLAGAKLLPSEVLSGIIIHPLTALLAGLLISGALAASGGFDAIRVLLNRLFKSPLGLAGTLVLLTQLPLLIGLPCGRILAAALLPMIFALGPEGMALLSKTQLIVLTGAFARNAFGSCGPSALGGVGAIGEGFLGQVGVLRAPQAFALMLGTAMVALLVKFITMVMYPRDVQIKDNSSMGSTEAMEVKAPLRGYIALGIFFLTIIIALFQVFGPSYSVQFILVLGTLAIMLATRVGIEDLLRGIILMPATAMVAGFLAAGSLAATGGFDALGLVFKMVATTPLGIAGMLVIFSQIQTLLPLPCGRVLTAALVPVLYIFGPDGVGLINYWQLSIIMAVYIINAAVSCGPSPLGGGGMMAEGTLRAETGYLRGAFSFASLVVMSPLVALFMMSTKFYSFQGTTTTYSQMFTLLGLTVILLVVGVVVLKWVSKIMQRGTAGSRTTNLAFFMAGGALAGTIITFAMDMQNSSELLQGALGGVLAGLGIALMTPSSGEHVVVSSTCKVAQN